MESLKKLASKFNKKLFIDLHKEMSFSEYLENVKLNPLLVRSAYQRIYDMVISKGTREYEKYRTNLIHYNFFDEIHPIFGLDETLDALMKFIKGAAGWFGTEKRVLLLHGPVGSSKSTICRRLKRGLEEYSRTDDGAWYTYKWINLPTGPDGIYDNPDADCPMHDDPIKLIPVDLRKEFIDELNETLIEKTPENLRSTMYMLRCEGELNPFCKLMMDELLDRNGGDLEAVLEKHIRVVRKVFSESDRVGIATFQPKDEKNQDATELTGDIHFGKISHYGKDSDPRSWSYDGEFCVAHRGMIEFIEMLKLAQEFLYDLLGASQERQIKPKKFSQISVDIAIIGHTNIPDFDKLKANIGMEALRDRTVRIDVPYVLEWREEIKVYEQDYGPTKVRQHVAPHTLETAALWAILTRLQDVDESDFDLVKKAKLYNGDLSAGWTEDSVEELKRKGNDHGEGIKLGISARYVQDKISSCLSSANRYINPFMVMKEIKEGLINCSLITKKDDLTKYMQCVDLTMKELDEILKDEVRKALVGDEEAMIRLCTNYVDNVMAYVNKSKIRNLYTKRDEQPDEQLMRSVEEKIDVSSGNVDSFRQMVAAYLGDCLHKKKPFKWDSNAELKKAFELKLFDDIKDTIKLSALSPGGTTIVNPEVEKRIDDLKNRLIKQFGYTEDSAKDVLSYVSSIFSRGSDNK